MFSTTHILFADVVYKTMRDKYRIRLNKNSLRYGSIKPDILSMFARLPHYKEESFEYILWEMKRLIGKMSFPGQLEDRSASRKAGQILHYISDYFCFAHNNEVLMCRMLPHLVYEQRLARFSSRRMFEGLRRAVLAQPSGLEDHKYDFGAYISARHAEYLSDKVHFSTDIQYAIDACMAAGAYLAEGCMHNVSVKTA